MRRNISSILDLMDRMGITPQELTLYFVKKGKVDLSKLGEPEPTEPSEDEPILPPQQRQEVIAILANKTGVDEKDIMNKSNFYNDLGYDSLDYIEVIMELEEKLNVQISDEEAEKITTIEDLMLLLKEKL